MWISALTCTAILFVSHAPAPAAEGRDAYESARALAGRDPDAHVRLALWCEAHGMDAERAKHLAIALLTAPDHPLARGLLGLVRNGNAWGRPEEVARREAADEARAPGMAEYRRLRESTPETADGQWDLARWCERHGLAVEAKAHFTSVTRLDPTRADAWIKLGSKLYRGRWLTPAQIDAEKSEAKRQAQADRHWGPILQTSRLQLLKTATRASAERTLAGVDDPRAVPAIWREFADGPAKTQWVAVQLFGQIAAPESSRGLAGLVACARSEDVRRAALESLARRDPRDYADLLIGLLRDPIPYEVKPVDGPGSPGLLFVRGERFDLRREYAAPPVTTMKSPFVNPGLAAFAYAGPSINGLPVVVRGAEGGANVVASNHFNDPIRGEVIRQYERRTAAMIAEAMKVALSSQRKLENDVRALESANEAIARQNSPIIGFLETVAGRSIGPDPESWRAWWVDGLGYAYLRKPEPPRPVLAQQIESDYAPAIPQGFTYSRQLGYQPMSCFAAGTAVWTLDGLTSIEAIRVGDRVLSQDVATGTLSYEPVLATFHNPPAETLRIRLGDETIVSSRFHRFWRAGRGWATARDLLIGDDLRTLKGRRAIESIEPGKTEPVFNLEVGGGKTFIVGQVGALVHDNTIPGTTSTPFDATEVSIR